MDNEQHVVATGELPLQSDSKTIAWLCATPCDDITRFLSTLLDDFPDLGMPTQLIRMEQPVSYKQLMDSLVVSDGTEIILVFSGHGATDALLGAPPAEGSHAASSSSHSRFYDVDSFDLGPRVLVAFCCSSGAVLGDAFRDTLGRAFMGFDSPIGFVTADGVYSESWKKILHQSTLKITSTADNKELRDFVEKLYLDAYQYFKSAEGQQHEWWFWMTLVLRGHLDALRVHGRHEGVPEDLEKAASP